MRRNGFTMVELIFVIVIIGILAATALPKFSGVKDNAKANSELSAMSSVDGAITAAIEFRLQDYQDSNVNWNGVVIPDGPTNNRDASGIYKTDVNDKSKVLSNILKKGEKFKIIGIVGSNGSTIVGNGNGAALSSNDILFITGGATDSVNGIAALADDIIGKPDKNDVWVFNPNSFDLNVSGNNVVSNAGNYSIVDAQSVKLIDVNTTTALNIGAITIDGQAVNAVTK